MEKQELSRRSGAGIDFHVIFSSATAGFRAQVVGLRIYER